MPSASSLVLALALSAVPIWPGLAPGSESWTQVEQTYPQTPLGPVAIDVVTPTLTPYLPARKNASGIGVIVAPGGACIALTLGLEGAEVAKRLQARGIATFLLKYRLQKKVGDGIPKDLNEDVACRYGMADAVQALKVVRTHASEWGVVPGRVGILGFSAGAMVASGALLQPDAYARPSFAALLYGAPFGVMPAVPAHLPPVFLAWAQDDAIARAPEAAFYDALRAAGNAPEAHIFASGGHGFGVRKQGTSSDAWFDEFATWLTATAAKLPAASP